ncbi:HAD-IA family hydrolase [candidate division KSB3 bacterium]|uniref:HAD-IA family hydrolase n=1 Tax=candidate division KSB3 bacterium TaxID=2044937 RepID=A0A9D5JV60_9BACT|nr:HAD-IA family hydrolase [candidate division KSB3 bacterium]MBD3324501.1 HAD-IA family hydrolase [candidate division KSB3 bacterium]
MTAKASLQAVIWDYDCTLADTWQKNLVVTRNILEYLTGRDARQIPALRSLDTYRTAVTRKNNWRQFYREECGLTEAQTDLAGRSWTTFQMQDNTPIRFFEGIPEVLAALRPLPQGIVSQNSQRQIAKALRDSGLLPYFEKIVGYEEVAFDRQKPAPDALLLCIEHLIDSASGEVWYIGDHDVDATCVFHANRRLRDQGSEMRVRSMRACYGCDHDTAAWTIQPDYTVHTPRDILQIIHSSRQLSSYKGQQEG